MKHYELAVIGSGPAGQKAAIQAAKLGKRVCIIEKNPVLGGAGINTGTIPSKALREAVLHLTGTNKRALYGENFRFKRDITIEDLIYVSQQVIHNELSVIREQLDRNNVDLIWGAAHFEGPNLLQIQMSEASEMITADKFVICTGTRPATPLSVPFNDTTIFTSDGLLKLKTLPKSIIIVGGGVIGVEYACMLGALGVRVILVEGRPDLLDFLDREIVEALQYQMRQMGITLRLGEKVAKIQEIPSPADPTQTLVEARLESGKQLHAACLLYSVGRQGTTRALALENVGLIPDDRERLKVNEHYQTAVPHIYAAGDVIGFPALASTAMEQGRLAVCHAFGVETQSFPDLFPYGIYAIPEISMVGKTEKQLTDAGIPYEAGIAHYKEVARGQLLGDSSGMLKMLIHQDTHALLGVHVIGTGATELIHIGQAVLAFNGTVEFFINNVFNYPTLAETYKVAAFNGLNKLRNI
ncbi:MAG TPA: Si-specific NAD(P)(+) transhydrogenase [Phycisphaerae bacterium]|jgi:NAD(P) transhydrogenase|nr:Si-specific NAD(P)(+) transhydrogenase [Phycisphaerae bacterium]